MGNFRKAPAIARSRSREVMISGTLLSYMCNIYSTRAKAAALAPRSRNLESRSEDWLAIPQPKLEVGVQVGRRVPHFSLKFSRSFAVVCLLLLAMGCRLVGGWLVGWLFVDGLSNLPSAYGWKIRIYSPIHERPSFLLEPPSFIEGAPNLYGRTCGRLPLVTLDQISAHLPRVDLDLLKVLLELRNASTARDEENSAASILPCRSTSTRNEVFTPPFCSITLRRLSPAQLSFWLLRAE